MRLPQVDEAAVVYHRIQVACGKLVAYVDCNGEVEDKAPLRAVIHLLPEYMVPTRLIIVTELPKNNTNGKVDRQHLRALLDE